MNYEQKYEQALERAKELLEDIEETIKAIAWLKKQDEQKPADEVESKFKVGDVLATGESVFIYAKVLYNKPYAYCGIDKFGVFKDNCLENNWSNSVDNIYPATKEQCDLLFQKMKEAGFEWDSTKKQLKKIELNVNVRLLPEVLGKHLYTCFTKTNHYVRSEEDHITLIEFINKIIADLNIK